jgi:hypothetical protein
MVNACFVRCDHLKGRIYLLASAQFFISQMNAHQSLNHRELSSALGHYFSIIMHEKYA